MRQPRRQDGLSACHSLFKLTDVIQKRLWCIFLSLHASLKEHEQFCCSPHKAEAALLISLDILELALSADNGARDRFRSMFES
jgi:hypothetical protein